MKHIQLFEAYHLDLQEKMLRRKAFIEAILDKKSRYGYKPLQWHGIKFEMGRAGDSNSNGYVVISHSQTPESKEEVKKDFALLGVKIRFGRNNGWDKLRIAISDPGLENLITKIPDVEILHAWMDTGKPISELDAFLHQKRGTVKGNEFGF
jgi:hypothetical protein